MAKRPPSSPAPSLAIFACVAALGCNSKKKACEHARDAMVEMTKADVQRAIEHAPEDIKASAEEIGDKQVASFNAHFVGACLEAPDDAMACVERVDQLIAAGDAHRAKVEACFDAEGGREEVDGCLDEARNELKDKTGGCEEVFGLLAREVEERAKQAGP